MGRSSITKILLLSIVLAATGLQGETIARVAKVSGKVFVKRLGASEFNEAVAPGAAINNGDALKVGDTGFAVVIFIDDRSIVKVKSNTEFQFIDTENTRSIDIDVGTIINHVAKQGRNKTFRVETPTSVASVKGTIFSAVVDPSGVDQFFGTEGVVEVFNVISGQSVNLTAGMKTISNALGSLVSAPAAPNEYPTDPETGQPPSTEETTGQEQPEGGQTEEAPTEEVQPQPEAETEETLPETEEVPEAQPEETPPTEQPETVPEETEGGGEGKPFNMGLGIGSVTIDGVIYNQFAFRPELKFGKLGVGLDLVIYIDNDGNVRKNEWDFKNDPGQILDKILYIRWGQKGDPFWAKWGALDNVTLGYGGLVSGYSNMMEFPTVRRIGVSTGVQMGNLGAEVFFGNIKDFSRGGTLMGLRSTYRISKSFPLTIGANFVMDMNQFSGLKDRDGDSYPDIFDDFPDDKHLWNDTDGDGIPDPHPGLDSSQADIDADGDNVYDPLDPVVNLKADPFSITDNKGLAMGYGLDIGYPIFKNKMISLLAYSELNMLNFPGIHTSTLNRPARSGMGITVPGIQATILKFIHAKFEYRIKQDYFVPQFFDQAYDLTRVIAQYQEGGETLIRTRDMILFEDETSKINTKGYYGMASADLLNIASFGASYTNMVADTIEFNSFTAQVNLNADLVPKLSVATAYYVRNNDPNPFDFKHPSENTVLGYRLGYEVSQGVSLIWDFRQFYRDSGNGLEPVKQTSIETAFNF
ncbi:MAG: hypothetical protein D6762_03935 [Candidatus Neomarinimicrobiota bacterium]|nr:MAG: hypothetical protein D6762_03935 [Candidatus Neomarinimicrobiota bacterium]